MGMGMGMGMGAEEMEIKMEFIGVEVGGAVWWGAVRCNPVL